MNKKIILSIVSGIFALAMIVMFSSQIAGKSSFWEDFSEQVYPVQNYAAVETANGNIPLWNPYSFGGMPFLADPQVGYFYLPNRLMGLFVSNDKLSPSALQILIILHFLLAQFAMFFFLRTLKRSYMGAMIAGIGYAFSMIFICHVFHPMMVYQFAWFPLAFAFFKKSLDKLSIQSALWTGLLFALIFHAGHPQTTVYLLLVVAMYFLWDIISKLRSKEIAGSSKILKYISISIIVGVIASGLYMVQLLPTRMLQDHAVRSEMTYEKTAEGSLEYKQILQLVAPKLFGNYKADMSTADKDSAFHLSKDGKPLPYYYYWDTGFFFGIAIFLLGLIGIIANIKKKIPGFLLLVALFGIAYALGSNFFIHPLLNKLPVLDYFRMPARILIVLVFAFSALAAYGFDYLADAKVNSKCKKRKLYIALIFPVLVLFGIAFGVITNMVDTPETALSYVKKQAWLEILFLVITVVSIFVVISIANSKMKSAGKEKALIVVGAVIAISLFADLYICGKDLNSRREKQDSMTGKTVVFSAKAEHEIDARLLDNFMPTFPNDIFRVTTRVPKPYNYPVIIRNNGMVNRYLMTDGYNQLNLGYRVPPTKERLDANNFLNAKYVFVIGNNGIRYYENKEALGHFRLYSNYLVLDPEQQKLNLEADETDYKNTVLIDAKPSLNIGDSLTNTSIKCIAYESNYIKCEVETKENAIMLVSEIWYPAWKAYIDSKEIKTFRADYSLRAVEIPAGKHVFEMKYESEAFKAGANISLIILILTILSMIAIPLVKKRCPRCQIKEEEK